MFFALGGRLAPRLRVRVDRLQGQEPRVHRRLRAADRADPDGAHPAAEPLLAGASRSTACRSSRAGTADVDHSFATVWIAHTIFALPLAVFLLHNFISEIPSEVIEAARVDGAGHGQMFFRIVLPLATPAIASFAVLEFIWVWNDLLVATIFAPSSSLPMTQSLASLSGTWGNQWYLQAAGTFLTILDAAHRVLRTAAVLRARTPGRRDEGLIHELRRRRVGAGGAGPLLHSAACSRGGAARPPSPRSPPSAPASCSRRRRARGASLPSSSTASTIGSAPS